VLIEPEPLPPRPVPADLKELCPGFEPTGMDQETWAMLPSNGLEAQIEFILEYVKDQWATAYVDCQERHSGLIKFVTEEVE
jgi:hypothetical protein